MQIANILLNLGGDQGNQVQKYGVTPAEVHVLQVIHGGDAVIDIDIVGDEKRSSKQERDRLSDLYKKAQPDGSVRSPAVDMLFPGVAARLYERFDEMDLDESFFRQERQKRVPAPDPLDHDSDGKKGGTAPSTETGLKSMTVAELKAHAEQNGIDLGDATKKADIIAAIELADEDQPAEPADEDEAADEDGGEFNEMPDANLFK
jgi:hypothetical protein